MAYSRWSNSYWYTFGTVPDNDSKAGQRFVICPYSSFSYRELTEDMDDCIVKVREAVEQEVKDKPEDAVYEELKKYMNAFINDVDKEYNE